MEQDSDKAAISLTLPWPSRFLSPNSRVHWSKKANEARRHRKDAWAIALDAIGGRKPGWSGAHITLTYHPPNRHRYDADNLLARSKSQIDGIADALGMNDNTFTFTFSVGDTVKGGLVKVKIEEQNV